MGSQALRQSLCLCHGGFLAPLAEVLNLYPLRLRSINVLRSRSMHYSSILQPHELAWKMGGQLTPRVLRGKLSCTIAPIRGRKMALTEFVLGYGRMVCAGVGWALAGPEP